MKDKAYIDYNSISKNNRKKVIRRLRKNRISEDHHRWSFNPNESKLNISRFLKEFTDQNESQEKPVSFIMDNSRLREMNINDEIKKYSTK